MSELPAIATVFFRVLKDVVVGDTIELVLRDRIDFYRVTNMLVLDPEDVGIVRNHPTPTLTLQIPDPAMPVS
jgi:sortase (surface protein transpeptidase)